MHNITLPTHSSILQCRSWSETLKTLAHWHVFGSASTTSGSDFAFCMMRRAMSWVVASWSIGLTRRTRRSAWMQSLWTSTCWRLWPGGGAPRFPNQRVPTSKCSKSRLRSAKNLSYMVCQGYGSVLYKLLHGCFNQWYFLNVCCIALLGLPHWATPFLPWKVAGLKQICQCKVDHAVVKDAWFLKKMFTYGCKKAGFDKERKGNKVSPQRRAPWLIFNWSTLCFFMFFALIYVCICMQWSYITPWKEKPIPLQYSLNSWGTRGKPLH